MKILNKAPFQNIIDFIDVTVDSEDLMNWLVKLEYLPNNLRHDHIIRMRQRMIENGEAEILIDILNLINNRDILSAINLVVKDVYHSCIRNDHTSLMVFCKRYGKNDPFLNNRVI